MVSDDVQGRIERPSIMDNGSDRHVRVLRDLGIKATSPRLQILQFMEASGDHVDADTIYIALKGENPSLSRTTVYNTLDLFRERGLVQRLTISGTEHRFELAKGMHHHLLCNSCGRIYDIDISCPYLGGMLHGEHKIEEVHGYFRGVCKRCLDAAPVE